MSPAPGSRLGAQPWAGAMVVASYRASGNVALVRLPPPPRRADRPDLHRRDAARVCADPPDSGRPGREPVGRARHGPGAPRSDCCTNSASTGRCRAVRRLHRACAQRRPRHVADHARAGARRVHHAVSGHHRARVFRDAARRSCIGLPAGIIAALRRNTVADYAVMGVSLTGYSMPIFWWALLLILFFSVQPGLDAGLGPHRRRVRRARGDRIHADRRAALGRAGRVPLGAVASDPAGDRAGHDPARGDRAHDALGDARGAARGLRAHGAREGLAALARGRSCTRCATR